MTYMIMETHLAYAIALDEEGRFLKVANLNYEVGQTVERVYALNETQAIPDLKSKTKVKRKWWLAWVSAAACLALILGTLLPYMLKPIGTVRLRINPDVRLSVNRLNYVTEIEGLNAEGRILCSSLSTSHKKVDQVSDELVRRAVDKGYLKDGGRINLTVESTDRRWKMATEEMLLFEFKIYADEMGVDIIARDTETEHESNDPHPRVTVPLAPTESEQKADYLPTSDGDIEDDDEVDEPHDEVPDDDHEESPDDVNCDRDDEDERDADEDDHAEDDPSDDDSNEDDDDEVDSDSEDDD